MPGLDEKQGTQRQPILKAGTISFDGSGIDCLVGPDSPEIRLPLYPRKRTQVGHQAMSVSCHERKSGALFDHFVGERLLNDRDPQLVSPTIIAIG